MTDRRNCERRSKDRDCLLSERQVAELAKVSVNTVRYWRQRCKEAEVEWVCNVVSAMLSANGMAPIPGIYITARGVLAASRYHDIASGRRPA